MMDTNKIYTRAKSTLLTPTAEWPVIAAEPDTVKNLYVSYVLIMAAIPPLAMFLSTTVFGVSVPFLGTYRIGLFSSLTSAVTTYVLGLVGVYILALIVDALAPTFGGQKNRVQALKTVAYAYTAAWVAALIGIIPGLTLIATLVGVVYSIYLLRLGLPFTMKCPDEKAVGYTAVTIIVALVVGIVLNVVAVRLTGSWIYNNSGMYNSGAASAMSHSEEGFEKGSTGAAIESWAKNIETASQKMDAAQKSGDTGAAANAVGQMLGAALGADGKIEALPPDRIKSFVPDSLGGLARQSISAERNAALGMQISKATGTYSDGSQRNFNLEITDSGSLHGLTGLATNWVGIEEDKQTDSGYEKTYKSGRQLVHEEWDNRSHHGQYTVVIADRYAVTVSGTAGGMDELKSALHNIDLAGLEALKSAGTQAQ
jgi:hypothetical protein